MSFDSIEVKFSSTNQNKQARPGRVVGSIINSVMILRRSTILCIRAHLCRRRCVSSTPTVFSDQTKLPSRRLFNELTERSFVDEQMSRSGRRPFEANVENPIIVKSFFVSDVNTEKIEFPASLSKAQLDSCKLKYAQISEYFGKHNGRELTEADYNAFKSMHLFGYNVPKNYGGQGYSRTMHTLASEVEAQNIAAAMSLNVHRMVCATISEFGSDEQCKYYLPKLATGELIGTTAFQEWNSLETIGLNTCAEYSHDDEHWLLRGNFE